MNTPLENIIEELKGNPGLASELRDALTADLDFEAVELSEYPPQEIDLIRLDTCPEGQLQKGTEGSAGFDLMTSTEHGNDIVLGANESKLLNTGVKIHIQDTELAGFIIPRSGKGNGGLVIGNLVGLIDSDYQGELKISLWNRTNSAMKINLTKPIAQLVISHVPKTKFREVESFEAGTDRGEGGFGHTDSKEKDKG